MKNDLISRQEALDVIMELIEARRDWISDASREINALDAGYCAIYDLPSVDAVQVIRCKDCKWWRQSDKFPRGQYCTRFFAVDYVWHSLAEDFCSLAERRKK